MGCTDVVGVEYILDAGKESSHMDSEETDMVFGSSLVGIRLAETMGETAVVGFVEQVATPMG